MSKQEIVVIPPSAVDIAALPLLADVQFLEIFLSESLNRKFFGIVRPGIFRGFNYTIGSGLSLTIGDETKQNTAFVERDGYTLTIQGQHAVAVTVPAGKKSAIVIEGFYKFGVKTKQVDATSNVDAAAIKVIPSSSIEAHHVVVCEVEVPAGTKQITQAMISLDNRREGGIDMSSHIEHEDPHTQYAFRQALADEIARALDAENALDVKFTQKTNKLSSDLTTESNRAKGEENRIDDKLDAEVRRSTNRDNDLQARIESLAATMASGIHARGPWDASKKTFPATPANNTADYYRISVSGSMTGNNQTIAANAGDHLYWEIASRRWYLIDNTDQVASVDGLTGPVKLPKSSATNSTSETLIANVHGVKKAFDHAQGALNRANDTWRKGESDARFLLKGETAANANKLGNVESAYNVENKSGHTVIKPKGGEYRTTAGGVTGAFKVKLPTLGDGTMMGMHFRLYDYATHESCELFVYGYSRGINWLNCSAYMLGNNKEIPVRFCDSETESYITIGNADARWGYPSLTLLSVITSHQKSEAHHWSSGWQISVVTTIPSDEVSQTVWAGTPYTSQRKPTWGDVGGNEYLTKTGTHVRPTDWMRSSGTATGFLPAEARTGSAAVSGLGNGSWWFKEAWVNSYHGGSVDVTGDVTAGGRLALGKVVDGKQWKFVHSASGAVDIALYDSAGTWDVSPFTFSRSGIFNSIGQIKENNQRVYSPNNKPTPAEVGAVNKAGDTMTGNLAIVKASPSLWLQGGSNSVNAGKIYITEDTAHGMWFGYDGASNVIKYGYRASSTDSVAFFHPYNSPDITFNGKVTANVQGTTSGSLTRKDYVDDLIAKKLSLTGGTMTGALILPELRIPSSKILMGGVNIVGADDGVVRIGDVGYVRQLNLAALDGHVYVTSVGKRERVFHEGYKPTWDDVGGNGYFTKLSNGHLRATALIQAASGNNDGFFPNTPNNQMLGSSGLPFREVHARNYHGVSFTATGDIRGGSVYGGPGGQNHIRLVGANNKGYLQAGDGTNNHLALTGMNGHNLTSLNISITDPKQFKVNNGSVYSVVNKPTWADVGGNDWLTKAHSHTLIHGGDAASHWVRMNHSSSQVDNHGFLPMMAGTGSGARGSLGINGWWFKEAWVNSYHGGSVDVTGDIRGAEIHASKHISSKAAKINHTCDWNGFITTCVYNVYKGNGVTFTNAPPSEVADFGTLEVVGSGSDSLTFVMQRFTRKVNGDVWVRCRNDGAHSWSAWVRMYSTANKPTWGDVGGNEYLTKTGTHVRPTDWMRSSGTATGFLPAEARTGSAAVSGLGNSSWWFKEAWVNTYYGGSVDVSRGYVHRPDASLAATTTLSIPTMKVGGTAYFNWVGGNNIISFYRGHATSDNTTRAKVHGDLDVTRNLSEQGVRVYSPNNKPTPSALGAVNKAGDTMIGGINYNIGAAGTYTSVRLPTYANNSKTYLRKFRGGNGDTIWHETVQGSTYRISTGNSDEHEVFKLHGLDGFLGGHKIHHAGNLTAERIRKITFGTAEPTGGEDGDVYIQYK